MWQYITKICNVMCILFIKLSNLYIFALYACYLLKEGKIKNVLLTNANIGLTNLVYMIFMIIKIEM